MVYQPIWTSLLALSETSVNLLRPHPTHARIDKSAGDLAIAEAQIDITAVAFLRALEETRNCVTNMFTAWSPQRECDKELLEALVPHSVHRDFNSTLYWMFIRLGKSQVVKVPQPESYLGPLHYDAGKGHSMNELADFMLPRSRGSAGY